MLPTIRFRPIALLVAILCVFAAPAIAADSTNYGSKAWTKSAVVLRDGPGTAYVTTGQVAAKTDILVDRCHYNWCQIRADRVSGWTSLYSLDFGQHKPRNTVPYPAGGPGEVCFYTGTSYSGAKSCAPSGTIVTDLKFIDMDDAVASISITGDVSVTVCRDFDFTSECRRLYKSQPSFDRLMNRAISSYRVY